MNTAKTTSTYFEKMMVHNRNFVSTIKDTRTVVPTVFSGLSEKGLYTFKKGKPYSTPNFHVEYKIECNLLIVPFFSIKNDENTDDMYELTEALRYLLELSKELQLSALSIAVKNVTDKQDECFSSLNFLSYRNHFVSGTMSTYTLILPKD